MKNLTEMLNALAKAAMAISFLLLLIAALSQYPGLHPWFEHVVDSIVTQESHDSSLSKTQQRPFSP